MLVATRRRRTREVTGPTPHSVAIFARPTNKHPPEQLILDRRRQEDLRHEAEELTKYNKLCDLKNDWERSTDRRIQLNTVKKRVDSLKQQHLFSIEDRRDRLREMLSCEEDQFLKEMDEKQETTIERQAKMRERAKQLRQRREEERQAFVQEKYKQQFRQHCEELRTTLSKREQDRVAAERMEQLKIKAEIENYNKADDEMYARLWYADIEAKARKEEEDSQRQMAANRETLGVLQKQMAALEAQKQDEKELVLEEAKLLREQAELRKLEEERALEDKRRKQLEVRQMYDKSLSMKRQKEARDLQEQLAFDMKILEQLLEESRNEAMEQIQRKKQLREENKRYMDYLKRMKIEEAERERELERLCDAEVEKTWDKKLKQWRLEREARRALLQDVLQTRQQQLNNKLAENEKKRIEAQHDREELLKKIEENKQVELSQIQKLRQQNSAHQRDLIGQIQYNEKLRDQSKDEQEREWRSQQEAEEEYRLKLEEALRDPVPDKIHPMRRRQWSQNSQVQDLLG